MYQQHFGMHTDPFPLSPRLAFVFPSRAFGETMAHLVYGIEQAEDIILITGGIGTGKTLAVNNLLTQIHRVLEPVVINVTRLTFSELVKTVLLELGETVAPAADTADLLQQLKRVLIARRREGRKVLLVVDEAQHLGVETLESLRLLTNLSTPEEQCLQLVLVGQHALEEAIGRRELAQLNQRIRVRYRIEPLSRQEVEAYLDHRVRIAGCSRHLFRPGAVDRIYELSRGTPRVVNILASRALLAAYVAGKNMIEPSHVRTEDLPPVTDLPEPPPAEATTAAPTSFVRTAPVGDAPPAPAPARLSVPMAGGSRRAKSKTRRQAATPPPVEPTDQLPYLVMPSSGPDQRTGRRGWLFALLVVGVVAAALVIWQWPRIAASRAGHAGRLGPVTTRTDSPPADQADADHRSGDAAPTTGDVTPAESAPRDTTATPGTGEPSADRSQTPRPQMDRTQVDRTPAERAAANAARNTPPRPVEPAATPAAVARPGDVVVHVGSFEDEAHAKEIIRRLAAAGFAAYEVRDTAGGQPWVRVYTGPFASTEAAEAVKDRLKSAGTVAYARVVTVGQ